MPTVVIWAEVKFPFRSYLTSAHHGCKLKIDRFKQTVYVEKEDEILSSMQVLLILKCSGARV